MNRRHGAPLALVVSILAACSSEPSAHVDAAVLDAGSGGSDAASSVDAARLPDAGVSSFDAGIAPVDAAMCSAMLETDDSNCGARGRSCFGQGCAAGLCTPRTLGTNGAATTGLVAGGFVFALRPNALPPSAYTLVRTNSDTGEETALYATPPGVRLRTND